MNVSLAELRRLAPKGKEEILAPLVAAMPAVLPAYGITTRARFCRFIAQAAWESDYFTTLNELGGSVYFEKRYGVGTAVGRRLGNDTPGDGARFHGRGMFQLTGRSNYALFGKRLGIDLLAHPELAARPDVSLRVACEYWKGKGLNALADAGNDVEITRRINGGRNGLKERLALAAKALGIWTEDASPQAVVPVPVPLPRPAHPIEAAEPAPAPPLPVPVEPVAEPVDTEMDAAPPIATEAPPSLGLSKTLWGHLSGGLSGTGFGYTVSQIFQSPNAVWLLVAAGGFLLILVLAGIIVFRERIAKRLELGV